MKRTLVMLAAGAVAAIGLAAPASADVSTNPSTKDAQGYCIANHIHNFNVDSGVEQNGIGWIRSGQTGTEISSKAGNRAPSECVTSQGQYAPISNNG